MFHFWQKRFRNRQGRIELLNRRDLALRLDRKAAYFTVLAHENSIHLYSRGIGGRNGQFRANTLHTTSKDGVRFRNPEVVLDDTHAAHNFFAFVDPKFGFRGIGGQNVTTGKPHSDGVYSFESQDGSTWTNEALVISPSHPGFIDATKIWGSQGDIDGHLCAYYDDARDEYVIFMRANPRQGSRQVQYATGKKFGAFGPLRLLDVEDFDIERGDNIYLPCFFKVDDRYFGLVPFVNPEYSALRMLHSEDGRRWRTLTDFFPCDPWVDNRGAYKNRLHAANGVVDCGDHLFVYIHHNYYGHEKRKPVVLSRYTLPKSMISI